MSKLYLYTLALLCLSRLFGASAPDHPLYFEDRGSGLFETRAAGQLIVIRADRIALDEVMLRFVQASKTARVRGDGKSAPSTYIMSGQTRTFQQYPKARIKHLYRGIDLTFYGRPGHFEYDLDLSPGAKPDGIRIQVDGARNMRLDEQGSLIVGTRSGELRQLAPRVFQMDHGVRRQVAANYVLVSPNEIGFQLGKHDHTVPVTIDPVIVYTKYFGGSDSDSAGPVATDAQGNVYVTGSTNSIDFPSTNGTRTRLEPPLLAFSNAGRTVTQFKVGAEGSVTLIAGTPDGKFLYVATPDGIFFSGTHGASFTKTAPLPSLNSLFPATIIQAISVDVIDPSRAYVATNIGLFATANTGQGWGPLEGGLASTANGYVNASSVQVSTVDHTILYATTSPYPFANDATTLYKSTNAGATWQQLNPAYSGEPAVGINPSSSIAFTLTPGGSDLYVVDGNANLLKSADGGSTWQQLAGKLYGTTAINIDPSNSSRIYVVDNYGVQRSADGGVTFATILPPVPGVVGVQAFAIDSTGVLYVANVDAQLEVSTDHGTTWQNLPPRPNPHVLLGLGHQVFAGLDSPSVPFVVKWSPDGSQMLYSTFFGGSFSDSITAISIDAQGHAVIAGNAASPDFPVTQTISKPSPLQYSTSGFVAKLSPGGTFALYSSIIGASQGVTVNGLALDASGLPYITGATPSPDFPTTANVLQTKPPSGMCKRTSQDPDVSPIMNSNGFVSKLSADGSSLIYSTFLSGSCGSAGQGIAVDSAGEAVVVGSTTSPDFPVSADAYQSAFPGGTTGGTTFPNAVDLGFITKLSAAGDKLIAGTFIGGGYHTEANALALDSSGDAYITGSTWGITPGATPGAFQTMVDAGCGPTLGFGGPPLPPSGGSDAFLLKLDPELSNSQFLTYLGGICDDSGSSVVLDPSGNVWVGGSASRGLPLVTPFEGTEVSNNFVGEFNADASQLLFSSYSDGGNLAADPSGAVYVAGTTYASDVAKNPGIRYPTTASLIKIDSAGSPLVIIDSIGPAPNTAGTPVGGSSPIAPGELIGIGGQHLGPSATVMAAMDPTTGRLPYVVGATSVAFDGYYAPIISIQDGLIVCFAPFEITGTTEVTVTVDGQKSNSMRIGVIPVSAYVLMVVNQDGSTNSASHPAPQGSVVTFYVTGLGVTSPLSQDGSVSAPPLPVPVMSVSVQIDGTQVTPQFAGAADGMVAGITQVNVQIPKATYPPNPANASVNNGYVQLYIGQ